nr:hypothetical protein [uncultured Pseudomonas sp.]
MRFILAHALDLQHSPLALYGQQAGDIGLLFGEWHAEAVEDCAVLIALLQRSEPGGLVEVK